MRLGIPLILAVFLGSPLFAADSEKIKDILDKAIEAQGGLEKVKQLRRIQSQSVGTIASPQGTLDSTREFVIEWPERPEAFRMTVVMQFPDGKKTAQVLVHGYDEGWNIIGGMAVSMTQEQLFTLRQEIFTQWVVTLLPLVESKFTLSLLKETTENNIPLVGIRVERRTFNPIDLYFDVKTGLLHKYSFRTTEVGLKVDKEVFLSKYEKFDGLRLPTKEIEYNNGKKKTSWDIKEYRFPEKIHPKEFTKPKSDN